MSDLKKIIFCSNCKKQIRIPADKHIRFSCPQCGTKLEYKNGEELTHPAEKSYHEEPKFTKATVVSSEPRKRTGNKKLLILILLILFAGGVIFLISTGNHKKAENYYGNTDTMQSAIVDTPSTVVDTSGNSTPIQPTQPISYQEQKDSAFNEALKEFGKELGKHLLEKLLDEIKEESEHGDWENANRWYEKTTDVMKHSGKKGRNLLKQYVDELAKLKSAIVSQNPNRGDLPISEQTDHTEKERNVATEEISNGTIYTLTLYYTGPVSKIETISPNSVKEITLVKGTYTIVAQVSGSNVQPYYGTQTYGGFHYDDRYYIEMR